MAYRNSHQHKLKTSEITILSLDDNHVIERILIDLFATRYTHRHCQSVHHFLHSLSSFKADIILLDINLPDGNGINLCRKIRTEYTNYSPYIIVLTGEDDRNILSAAYNAGADDFIRKPFDPFEMRAKVHLIAENIVAKADLTRLYDEVKLFNRKFYKLTQVINRNINEITKRDIISSIEDVIHIIGSSYCEVVLFSEPHNTSYKIQEKTNQKFLSFKQLKKHVPNLETADKDVKNFKIKRGGETLHITCYRLMFNRTKSGFVIIESYKELHKESTDMLKLYLDFINMKGIDIDIKKQLKEEVEKERKEIARVRTIQVSLLPDFKDIPGFKIASTFIPMEEISGDFFDGFYINEKVYQFVVCDVSGHGMASSYVGSAIRSIIRTISADLESPGKIAATLNNILTQTSRDLTYFATLFLWQINFHTGELTYVSGGHPESMLYNQESGEITQLAPTGPLVGFFEDAEFNDRTMHFSEKDLLFVYTDGLIEANDPATNNLYGTERLHKTLKELATQNSPLDILHGILGDLYNYTDYSPMEDDLTIICMRKCSDTTECL